MESKKITNISGINYLWKLDNMYLAGQPSVESLEEVKKLGVKKIINLRDNSEMDFSGEISQAEKLGLEYIQFPIVQDGALIAENCERLSQIIQADGEGPHFIHCGSANRVGGWLMTYLHQYKNIAFDEAIDIATENGLSNVGFIDQARDICKHK